ncbi:hypothetical protein [uncultured Mycolicibacterium sp.]|uniref:hypothetical protein n=1 Tax=uncultured Mycolicibacterium sp. TaxID=2320817 RepID=UPI0032B1FDCE
MKPAYRKEVPTVKIDRYTNSGVEDEDLTRYHFAKASLLLRELADTASRAFVEGRVFSEVELRQMHQDLNGVWDIVVSETVDCIAPQDGGSADDLEAYHVLYSDGSPVTTVNFAYVDAMHSVPTHFRESEITHLPVYTGSCPSGAQPVSAGCATLHEPPQYRPCSCDCCQAQAAVEGLQVTR